MARGSPNTADASSNDTPGLARFSNSFSGSYSNCIPFEYSRGSHRSISSRSTPHGQIVQWRSQAHDGPNVAMSRGALVRDSADGSSAGLDGRFVSNLVRTRSSNLPPDHTL